MNYNIHIDPRLLEEDGKRFGTVHSKPTIPYYKSIMVETYDPVPNPFQHGLYNNETAMFSTSTGYVCPDPRKPDLAEPRLLSHGFDIPYNAHKFLSQPGKAMDDAGFGCFRHADVLDKIAHSLAGGEQKLSSHAGSPAPWNAPTARKSKAVVKKNKKSYVYRPR